MTFIKRFNYFLQTEPHTVFQGECFVKVRGKAVSLRFPTWKSFINFNYQLQGSNSFSTLRQAASYHPVTDYFP